MRLSIKHLLSTIVLFFIIAGTYAQQKNYYLLIGTYTRGKSEGIYVYRFNTGTGAFDSVSVAKGVADPSYLAITHDGKYVYAVNESGKGKPNEVSAFSFDNKNGRLSFLDKVPSGGPDPCHIAVDRNEKWVFVANYSGGNLTAFPIQPDGSLKPYTQLIQHEGHSVNPKRQEKAHVHCVVFSPDERYLFTADLGMDEVMTYKVDHQAVSQPLQPASPAFVKTPPGSGPRHLTFHPNHRFAYLIHEMGGLVTAFDYHNGKLTPIQTISSHPADFSGQKGSAAIHVSPDGKFLYASNRMDANSLCIYAIDQQTGKLTVVGFQSVLGKTPRNFVIDPSGHFVLVANQDSDNIVIFKRNAETGLLEPLPRQIHLGNPVCLKFTPVK